MDPEMLGLMFRGIERLIIVTAAFAAIWQGFRLFSTVVSDKGSFEGSVGEWKIKLQRIAPGVFFACFGAIVLLFSVNSPFKYNYRGSYASSPEMVDDAGSGVLYISSYPGEDDAIKAEKLISDLTTVTGFFSMPDVLGKLSMDDRMYATNAIVRLRNHRLSLIDVAFGKGWRVKYHEYREKFKTPEHAKVSLSENEYKTYMTIVSSLAFKQTK